MPFRWTDAVLREAIETFGPTISVELFRPKEGEPGFGTRHKGFGKVAFQHPSGLEALFAQSVTETDPRHGEQLIVKLSGEKLVLRREQLDERAVAQEQTRVRAEAGMTTRRYRRVHVECVGSNRVSLELGAPHEFKLKIKNNSIKMISLPHTQRMLLRLTTPAQ